MSKEKYTPKQRREIAGAFRAAKEHLWNGSGDNDVLPTYICFALARIGSPPNCWALGMRGTPAVRAATEIVMSRIAPETVLSDWVLNNVRPHKSELTRANMQQYRRRWLDALAEEFSA
jgi:hypothetical protein